MPAPRLAVFRPGPGSIVTALVAAVLFWVAYDNGGYGLESRSALAIALWWAVIVAVVFGLLPSEKPALAMLVLGGLLAALALWTLASLLWSPSAEKSFDEFNRVSLYLATFALASVASSRRNLGRWADGLAIAVSAVAVVALVSRFFPGSFPTRDLGAFLPGAVARLSFPLGYWNGLAIFVALGVPLLLRIALVASRRSVCGLALAPMPVIASVIYLASSRGGVATALVGSVAFLALTERRWAAAAALLVSMLGGGAAIALLLGDELVNGPLGTDLVERQGRSGALGIALACAATSAVYWVGCRLLAGRLRPSPAVGWAAVLVALAVATIVVAAADPAERFRAFKAPGEAEAVDPGDFVKQHLLSSSGSGRWQFWNAAVDEWRAHPVLGDGAGSYESWWAQHGSIARFVKDAHSLYLESLGELGVVGLGLVLALFVIGVCVGVSRARRATGEVRITVAALTAAIAAYGVAAGIEWVWELTAVSVLAFAALALVSGSAAVPPAPLEAVGTTTKPRRFRGRFGVAIAALVIAWILIVAQTLPLLAERQIAASQAAVERGDLGEAYDDAEAARDIQSWAATPYLQLALVSEADGDLRRGRLWIEQAIVRDDRDWRLWLVAARLETKLGHVHAAERSLRRAAALNPRSPLFEGLLEATPS